MRESARNKRVVEDRGRGLRANKRTVAEEKTRETRHDDTMNLELLQQSFNAFSTHLQHNFNTYSTHSTHQHIQLTQFNLNFLVLLLHSHCLHCQADVVGLAIFAYSYVVTIPSWVNEKCHHVSVNRAVWIPATVGLVMKVRDMSRAWSSRRWWTERGSTVNERQS